MNRQYYVKVYPNTSPSNDMHNGGYERRCRDTCYEIERQIKRLGGSRRRRGGDPAMTDPDKLARIQQLCDLAVSDDRWREAGCPSCYVECDPTAFDEPCEEHALFVLLDIKKVCEA